MLDRPQLVGQEEDDDVMVSWEHTCATCGKLFYVVLPTFWVYKDKKMNPRWFCGYNCSRAGEKRTKAAKRGESCITNMRKNKLKHKLKEQKARGK